MQELFHLDIPDYLFFLIVLLVVAICMSGILVSQMVAFLAGCVIALSWSAYKRMIQLHRNI